MSRASEYEMARRRRLHEAGLCEWAGCGQPCIPGKRHCEEHRVLRNTQQRAMYQQRLGTGRCRRCDRPRVNSQFCAEHQAKALSYQKAWRERRKAVAA